MSLNIPQEQRNILRDILEHRAPDFLNLLDSPEVSRLSADQRDQLREIVMDEFCATGLCDNSEPNAPGLVSEDLVDRLGRL